MGAFAQPLQWAGIHAFFVLCMSVVCVASWRILDPVIEKWHREGSPDSYAAGTWGPAAAARTSSAFTATTALASRFWATSARRCAGGTVVKRELAAGQRREVPLDQVVTESVGVRWATAGPFESYHLGGGPGGIRHLLEHLGPGMARRWKDLGQPELPDSDQGQFGLVVHPDGTSEQVPCDGTALRPKRCVMASRAGPSASKPPIAGRFWSPEGFQ